jgi:hypothetical protein
MPEPALDDFALLTYFVITVSAIVFLIKLLDLLMGDAQKQYVSDRMILLWYTINESRKYFSLRPPQDRLNGCIL